MTDYVDLSTLKDYLRINPDDDTEDEILQMAITSASAAIDSATGRTFGPSTALEDRYYQVYRIDYDYFVNVDDVFDTTGLAVKASSDGGTTYTADVLFAPLPRQPGQPVRTLELNEGFATGEWVQVSGHFGYTAIPEPIRLATLLQANRYVKRRDAPYGVAGSVEMGSEMRLLNKLDPDVEVLIRPYKRIWVAA